MRPNGLIVQRSASNAGKSADRAAPQFGVLLTAEDQDLGLAPIETAAAIAEAYANENGVAVYLRDPITDEVLVIVDPLR